MRKIGVLGSAVVGQTLARGFKGHGYDVRIGSRTPAKLSEFSASAGIPAATFSETAAWADLIVLAVRGAVAEGAIRTAGAGHLAGKIVSDTTNPITEAEILTQFGWEPADMGTAVAARAIEPLCQLWCIPGFRQNRWTHAFAVFWS